MNKKIVKALNKQIEMEASSSHHYLAMASWAESEGYNGTAEFLYTQSEEEREHMLRLVRFVNERGAHAIIPSIKVGEMSFNTLHEVFSQLLEHEVAVTESINKIVFLCLEQKDYTTHAFLQWFVTEQLEEEALARTILDKLNLIGDDKGGIYLFDRDLENFKSDSVANENE